MSSIVCFRYRSLLLSPVGSSWCPAASDDPGRIHLRLLGPPPPLLSHTLPYSPILSHTCSPQLSPFPCSFVYWYFGWFIYLFIYLVGCLFCFCCYFKLLFVVRFFLCVSKRACHLYACHLYAYMSTFVEDLLLCNIFKHSSLSYFNL